jgi:hypothetical protein
MTGLRILKLSLILLTLIMGAAAQAQEEGLPVKYVPREGHSLGDLLPHGWTVEREVNGDLNGDGVSDIAAILIQDKPDLDESGAKNERQRGLIVLLGHKQEKCILRNQ